MKKIVFGLCFAISVALGAYTGPALSTGTGVEAGLEIMFTRPECDNFLLSPDAGPVPQTTCGGRQCSFPENVCFLNSNFASVNDLESNTFICVPTPQCCLNAARSTVVNSVSEAKACAGASSSSGGSSSGGSSSGSSGGGGASVEPAKTCKGRRALGTTTCSNKNPGRRFYYVPTRGKCYAFNFRGCGGNGNRYNTMAECTKACAPAANKCDALGKVLRDNKGACARKSFYYWSLTAKKCGRTRGCPSGKNQFPNIRACRQQCPATAKKTSGVSSCGSLKIVRTRGGDCKTQSFWAWSKTRCIKVKGCSRNSNNFKTKAACNAKCA